MPPASIACIMSAADPEKFIRFVLLLLESKGASIIKLVARHKTILFFGCLSVEKNQLFLLILFWILLAIEIVDSYLTRGLVHFVQTCIMSFSSVGGGSLTPSSPTRS